MLYTTDAGAVSRSRSGLARTMAVMVMICREFGLAISETKRVVMHLWAAVKSPESALRIEAAGQRYEQMTESVYLIGVINEDAGIARRISVAQVHLRMCCSQLYDGPNAQLSLRIQRLKQRRCKLAYSYEYTTRVPRVLEGPAQCSSHALAENCWLRR